MFENPRRGRQARNFTTNAPKILDLKSSSEQIFSRKLPLGAPAFSLLLNSDFVVSPVVSDFQLSSVGSLASRLCEARLYVLEKWAKLGVNSKDVNVFPKYVMPSLRLTFGRKMRHWVIVVQKIHSKALSVYTALLLHFNRFSNGIVINAAWYEYVIPCESDLLGVVQT